MTMMFSSVDKCGGGNGETASASGYSPLDLRGAHLSAGNVASADMEETDSDINVDSDDDMIHVPSHHSGEESSFVSNTKGHEEECYTRESIFAIEGQTETWA
jgi:hypothetical protein